jgi:hypothetical protein
MFVRHGPRAFDWRFGSSRLQFIAQRTGGPAKIAQMYDWIGGSLHAAASSRGGFAVALFDRSGKPLDDGSALGGRHAAE